MGWFGKLTFGSLGFFLGGPLGAIAGAALGHHLVDKNEGYGEERASYAGKPRLDHTEKAQATYFISLFSILGQFAKIDGVVSGDEMAVVNNFIDQLKIGDGEKQFARRVFNEAKNSSYSIDDFAFQLYRTNRQQPTILLSFMNLLFQIAAADGKLHPAEETTLRRIKEIFQINEEQYNSIKGGYFNELDMYYKILNSTSKSTPQEIKSNYKKLVKDFHPDRVVSKGLPEEFTEFATKRFREIQEAYEIIRKERKF
ncbi:MAG: TerB family tellurite resistance protein [Deltaproteobacteria bacterium]|nr:TerB family tellurite resistance protein [Deltaproteobacteria bacterium]